jgi:hypothetical protein
MKYKKEGVIITLFAIFIVAGLFYRNRFKHNYYLTIGRVNYIDKPVPKGSGDYCVNYNIFIDGKIVNSFCCYSLCNNLSIDSIRKILINKEFPVACFTENSISNKILITESDNDFFSIKMIDSLKIYDSILNCK